MKILAGVTLYCLLTGNAAGQRGGIGGGMRGGIGGFRGTADRFGGRAGSRFIGNRSFFERGLSNYGWPYPAYYGGDSAMPVGDASESVQGTVILVPLLPPEPPEPPPPPARPVMHEYHWPASNSDDAVAVFSIVTNDKRIHYATMVWIDGDELSFVDSHGGTGRIPRSSISRDLTYKANPGKNLKPWLP